MNINSNCASPLANELQNQVEKQALRIMASPKVRAAREKAREVLLAHPIAKLPDARARLEGVLDERLAFLTIQNIGSDIAIPRIIWFTNISDYSWFGHHFPGSAAAIDCPDNVYRHATINGSSHYEVIGKKRALHPAQFCFDLTDHPGVDGFAMTDNFQDIRGYQMLTTDNMVFEADGSFRITLDPLPANGRTNHIQTLPDRKFMLIMRDTCSDWRQSPNELTVRHIGGAPLPSPMGEQELIDLTADNLAYHQEFWLRFMDHFPNSGPNIMSPAYGRTRALGFAAVGRYELRDDQAMVIQIAPCTARYVGMQLTDAWMIAANPRKHLGSYNPSQTVANPDGSKTYIISPTDPGYANWVDTAGCHQGWIQFRWQGGTASIADPAQLVQKVTLADLADVPRIVLGSLPKVGPEQRREEVATRDSEWGLRIAGGH